MTNYINSPQSIIKIIADLILYLNNLLTNWFIFGIIYITKLLNTCTESSTIKSALSNISLYFNRLIILIKQITTMINNFIGTLTNTERIDAKYYMIDVKTDFPSDNKLNFILKPKTEHTCSDLIPVESTFDNIFNIEFMIKYVILNTVTDVIVKKSAIFLKYRFCIDDPNTIDSNENLIVVPDLIDVEDKTPEDTNGSPIPPPLNINETNLELIYVFKSKTTQDLSEYDPSNSSSSIPTNAILVFIKLIVKGPLDRSNFSLTTDHEEILKIKADIKITHSRSITQA